MTDIDLTEAVEEAAKSIMSEYEDGLPSWRDLDSQGQTWYRGIAKGALEAALPHILSQVEARVKPARLDVMPTRDEIARIIWTAMEGGETEGRTDGPLGWDYAAADAVLALWPGRTEQEVRRAAYDDLIAELLSVTEDYVSIAALSGIVDGLLARGGDGR